MFGMNKKNKNIQVGIGASNDKNAYQAAISAAKEAIKDFDKEPTFNIVYTNSEADQKQILKGINEVLGTNWVGSSVDKQISSKYDYDKDMTVSVISLKSDYLHFGVGVAENYKKKPTEKGNKSIEQAMKNAKVDKYIDSFIQFTRIKTQDYSNIVKTPPYFIFTIIGSVIKKKGEAISGNESNFLEGIISKVGPHVPVFGLGSGSDFNKFIDDNTKETTNYQFANGKLYENSAITVFVISNLYFEIDVQHGYINTNKFAIITKIHKEGFDILELNGKEPVEEYCKLINVKKEEYLKDPFSYSLKNPFGITMMDNQIYIKEVYPNSDKKTLHSTYKLQKNTALNILKYDEKGLLTTMESIITKSKSKNKKKEIAFSLYTNCCSRRLLMDDKEKLANDILKKKHKNVPFFGCYAFSEIGSTKTNIAQVHGETVTALIIYDALLSDK